MKIGDWYGLLGALSTIWLAIIRSSQATRCFVCSAGLGNCLEKAGGDPSAMLRSASHSVKFSMSFSHDEKAVMFFKLYLVFVIYHLDWMVESFHLPFAAGIMGL